jgi:hypothetical protein
MCAVGMDLHLKHFGHDRGKIIDLTGKLRQEEEKSPVLGE